MYQIIYSTAARKDAKKVGRSGLKDNVQKLLALLANNPFQNPPPYEKLIGDLREAYSRRINVQHRLVYQVYEESKQVKFSECGRITNKPRLGVLLWKR